MPNFVMIHRQSNGPVKLDERVQRRTLIPTMDIKLVTEFENHCSFLMHDDTEIHVADSIEDILEALNNDGSAYNV